MPRMSSLVQMPDRSGCPHGVRGAFQFGSFAFAAVVSAGIDRSRDGVRVGPGPNWASTRPAIPVARDRHSRAVRTCCFIGSFYDSPVNHEDRVRSVCCVAPEVVAMTKAFVAKCLLCVALMIAAPPTFAQSR